MTTQQGDALVTDTNGGEPAAPPLYDTMPEHFANSACARCYLAGDSALATPHAPRHAPRHEPGPLRALSATQAIQAVGVIDRLELWAWRRARGLAPVIGVGLA